MHSEERENTELVLALMIEKENLLYIEESELYILNLLKKN